MDGELSNRETEEAAFAEESARFLKAIGNPWRVRLLQELLHEPLQVSDLEHRLGLGQAYVSQQLARLRTEGIVTGDRNGRAVHYRIVDARVEPVLKYLNTSRTAVQSCRVGEI